MNKSSLQRQWERDRHRLNALSLSLTCSTGCPPPSSSSDDDFYSDFIRLYLTAPGYSSLLPWQEREIMSASKLNANFSWFLFLWSLFLHFSSTRWCCFSFLLLLLLLFSGSERHIQEENPRKERMLDKQVGPEMRAESQMESHSLSNNEPWDTIAVNPFLPNNSLEKLFIIYFWDRMWETKTEDKEGGMKRWCLSVST